MSEGQTDRIAREAARLMDAGKAASIGAAIAQAMEALKSGGPRPSEALVRRHAQALAMQSLGSAGYEERNRRIWTMVEELMTGLEQVCGARVLLVGRAARGHFDADAVIHVRAYSDLQVGDLAQAIVDFGFQEPAFKTLESRLGRVNQLRFEEQGVQFVVTRLPPSMTESQCLDLVTGEPQPSCDAAQLRRQLGQGVADEDDAGRRGGLGGGS